MPDPVITIALPVEVDATLTLTYTEPRTGKQVSRPVTADDLHRLRLRHENDMYDATRRNLEALGFDGSDDGIGSQLRYFVEHTTHWDGVHDIDPDEFVDLVRRLRHVPVDDEGALDA